MNIKPKTKLLNKLILAVQETPMYNNTTDKYLKIEIIKAIRRVLGEIKIYGVEF
jgi:DNA-dependent RNA polymerase auxiliary subunit epsilon